MLSKFQAHRAEFAPNLVQKLRVRFYIVLALLALVFVANYFILQQSIHQLGKDARVINIAGRQRMYSQIVARKASLMADAIEQGDSQRALELLQQYSHYLQSWSQNHNDLLNRSHEAHLCGVNSDKVNDLFGQLQPEFDSSRQLSNDIIAAANRLPETDIDELKTKVAKLNFAVDTYLPIMDKIVWQYQLESQQSAAYINSEKMWLVAIVVLILGISIFCLLEPAAKSVKKVVDRIEAYLDALDRTQGRIEFAPDGTILDANDNFLKIMGYKKEELLGQHHSIFVSERERGTNEYLEFWLGLQQGTFRAGEFVRVANDKSPKWIQANYNPVFDTDGKTVTKIVEYMVDITDQKEMIGERFAMREDIKQAIDGCGVGLWNFDPTSGYNWYSPQLKTQLGFGKDEFHLVEPTAEWWLSRIHPDDKDTVMSRIQSHLDKNIPYDVEFRMKTRHGGYCWFRALGKAIRDGQGRPIRMAGSLSNISAQKDAEHTLRSTMAELEQATAMANSMAAAAEAANMAKSEFLANMSHEIRTPMTAILGFVDLLENDEEVRQDELQSSEAIDSIRRNSNHLLELINDILDMSKIEAGRMTVEKVQTDPSKLVSDTITLVKSRAEAKGIELSCEFETAMPSKIESDPTRLRQILINLVGNAIKFTERGSVKIKASCDANKQQLKFSVIDTGIGLTDEQIDVISEFDAFNQADASTTRKFGGTGLGLRISNSFAQLLGGKIHVASTYGKGSTFTVIVATGDIDAVAMNSDERSTQTTKLTDINPAVLSSKPLSGIRVLLAEDGPDNQRLISFVLKKAGAEVTIAENGRIAVDNVQSDNQPDFDLILMDMQMPELDGYGATRLLRKRGYKIPIVALTAHAMAGDRQKCLDAGCDDYATKPIDRNSLIQTVAEHVQSLAIEQPA